MKQNFNIDDHWKWTQCPLCTKMGSIIKKKMQLKVIKSIYTNFITKEMCLQNPWRSSIDHSFECHSFIVAVLMVNEWNVCIEHWWDDCWWERQKHLEKTLFHCYFMSPINLTWAMGLNLGPYTDMATTKQLTWAKRCASWWKIHSKFDYIWNIIFLYECQCYSVEKIRCIWRIRSQGLRKLANSTVQNHEKFNT